jgi:hypothetical protein
VANLISVLFSAAMCISWMVAWLCVFWWPLCLDHLSWGIDNLKKRDMRGSRGERWGSFSISKHLALACRTLGYATSRFKLNADPFTKFFPDPEIKQTQSPSYAFILRILPR